MMHATVAWHTHQLHLCVPESVSCVVEHCLPGCMLQYEDLVEGHVPTGEVLQQPALTAHARTVVAPCSHGAAQHK